MVMEANQETIIGLSSAKGRRTKRQRPVSPLSLQVTSSAGESGTVTGESRIMTPTTSVDDSSFDTNNNIGGNEEEEDMANCLMLLAQGSREINRKLSPLDVRTKPSAYDSGVYRCKTCNRGFPSFQALGGHRASHKKPNIKLGKEENKTKLERTTGEFDHQNRQFLENPMSTTLSLQTSNHINYSSKANNNKIHECSVCGAEFSSGQALGGHMRRHRAVFPSSATATALPATIAPSISLINSSSRNDRPEYQETKRQRSNLQLDLNLPAESEEDDNSVRQSKFHFPSKDQVLVFSANSLVDCHY